MQGPEVGPVVVTDRELDGVDPVEIIVGEPVKQARLMTGLDLQLLGDPHDQRPEQVDHHDVPLLRLVQQPLDHLALHQTEDDQRVGLLRERDHATHLGDRARVAEDPQSPAVTELDHRRADGGAAP